MKFWLLTHSEELKKENSSGNLSARVLADHCQQVIWQRKHPAKEITELDKRNTMLIYPSQNLDVETSERHFSLCDNVVILDGTWQQARKMYNQSPYLREFHHYQIIGLASQFKRRRNQIEGGLCTAEAIVHLLQKKKLDDAAKQLGIAFEKFNEQCLKD